MNSIGSRLNLRHLLGLRAHRASIWRTLSSAKTTTAAAKSKTRPVVYTESKAFKYKASENFRVKEEELSYNKHTRSVVLASLGLFLVYFGYLREPNEIDEVLDKGLFELMPQLEEPMYDVEARRIEAAGGDASFAKKKLEEIKSKKATNDTKS